MGRKEFSDQIWKILKPSTKISFKEGNQLIHATIKIQDLWKPPIELGFEFYSKIAFQEKIIVATLCKPLLRIWKRVLITLQSSPNGLIHKTHCMCSDIGGQFGAGGVQSYGGFV